MNSPVDVELSREEVRAIDAAAMEQLGIPGLVLMENAARGVADIIRAEFATSGRIVIACGYGNNGGDGLAIARQLLACGVESEVVLIHAGKDLSSDASANLQFLQRSDVPVLLTEDAGRLKSIVSELSHEDLIVDALLGTGVRGSVRSPFEAAISAINDSPATVLAVDLPSGMDCDTGKPCGICVRAQRTVTFVSRKRGFSSPEGQASTGKVSVAHIGLPDSWVRRWLMQQRSI